MAKKNKFLRFFKSLKRKNNMVLLSSLFATLTVVTIIITIIFSSSNNFRGLTPTKAPSVDKKYAQYAIVNMNAEPITLNSLKATDSASKNILRHIQEGLVRLDQKGTPIPAVAASWEVSKDNLVWTFKLRENSVWKDGSPVTANDFVYAFTLLLTGEGDSSYVDQMKIFNNANAFLKGESDISQVGFKAIDNSTLVLTLETPTPGLLTMLTNTQFAPINKVFYEANKEMYGVEPDKIFFNGPWYPKEWVHDERVVLVKNNYYWNFNELKLDQLLFLSAGNTDSKVERLKSKDYDLITVSADEIQKYTGEGFTVKNFNDGATVYLEFNTSNPITANVHLRKALSYGLDRQAFVDKALNNSSKSALSLVNPAAFYNDLGEFKIETSMISDKTKATDLIQAAKAELELAKKELTKEQLNSIKITVDDSAFSKNIASSLATNWKNNLGLDVTVESLSYADRVTNIQDNNYQILINSWDISYPNVLNVLGLFNNESKNNFTNYKNEEFYKSLGSLSSETNATNRSAIISESFTILRNDLPIAPLYYRQKNYISLGRVKNIIVDAYRDIDFYYAYADSAASTKVPVETSSTTAEAANPTTNPTDATTENN